MKFEQEKYVISKIMIAEHDSVEIEDERIHVGPGKGHKEEVRACNQE